MGGGSSMLMALDEAAAAASGAGAGGYSGDPFDLLTELREFDVPYAQRVSIDADIRVGTWCSVTPLRGGAARVVRLPGMVQAAEPRVLAWDIETTKAPLMFPNAAHDQIYMVSYMLDGVGFLLINREIVSEDVPDFEYSPTRDYAGPFTVRNLPDEAATIRAFLDHIQEVRPNIFVTYNGDYFDWPFLEARCTAHGFNMRREIGIWNVAEGMGGGAASDARASAEYRGRVAVHMDW